jgi:hypothetical protein
VLRFPTFTIDEGYRGPRLKPFSGPSGVTIAATRSEVGVNGQLYVAGRRAAGLQNYALGQPVKPGKPGEVVTAELKFVVAPQTVDAFWSAYGGVSHASLFYRGRHFIYKVRAGHLSDGVVTVEFPSLLQLPHAPGPRLPRL